MKHNIMDSIFFHRILIKFNRKNGTLIGECLIFLLTFTLNLVTEEQLEVM